MVIDTIPEELISQLESAHRWPIGAFPAAPIALLDGAVAEADQPPEGQKDDEEQAKEAFRIPDPAAFELKAPTLQILIGGFDPRTAAVFADARTSTDARGEEDPRFGVAPLPDNGQKPRSPASIFEDLDRAGPALVWTADQGPHTGDRAVRQVDTGTVGGVRSQSLDDVPAHCGATIDQSWTDKSPIGQQRDRTIGWQIGSQGREHRSQDRGQRRPPGLLLRHDLGVQGQDPTTMDHAQAEQRGGASERCRIENQGDFLAPISLQQ